MRYLLALLFFIHGVAHLPGFVVAWQLRAMPELPHTTTVLGGRVDIGSMGMKALGLAWLVVAIACVAAAAGFPLRAPWSIQLAWAVIAVSVVLSVLGWPAARLGLVMNVVLAALLVVSVRFGWIGG